MLEITQMDEIQEKKPLLSKSGLNEIKTLLIKCIETIAINNKLVKEVAQYDIAQKLCDLFNYSKDKITKWISIKLLVTICEAGLIIDFIYRSINIESLLVGMNTNTDIELARVCFSLFNYFSTDKKLQQNVLSHIPAIKKYILECLSDTEIEQVQKVECIELLQFLVSNSSFLKYCYDHNIEELLVKILHKAGKDKIVISAVLKTFIVLHASSIFNESGILVGKALKKEKGIDLILEIYEDYINRSTIEDWDFIKIIVQTIFMLNFDPKILEVLKYTNVVLLVEKTISRALEEGSQNRLVLECLKV